VERVIRAPLARSQNGRQAKGAACEEFWALRDVSFEVKTGEVIGIIGRNGAGKSTLLKILSRITEPTSGRVRIRGRVSSLLEVGTGFHPELTGRENIFLNGAILGMTAAEIKRKFDEIVAFAEIDKFLDTPVKRYSSGMYVRLAFAVAAHLEPEILLVDEVLAVGDMAFRKKCLGKMDNVARGGRTVLFVSHNMAAIKSLCKQTILLSEGQVKGRGLTDQIVEQYHQVIFKNIDETNLADRKDRSGSGNVRAVSFEVRNTAEDEISLSPGASVEFLIGYEGRNEQPISKLYAGISVRDSDDVALFACTTAMTGADFYSVPARGLIRCRVPHFPLVPGRYSVTLKLIDNHGWADYVTQAATFDVVEGRQQVASADWGGSVVVPHEWRLEVPEAQEHPSSLLRGAVEIRQ